MMRVGFLVALLLMSVSPAWAASERRPATEGIEPLDVRVRELPAVRAYVHAPGPEWAKATGTIKMKGGLTPEQLAALDKARAIAAGALPPGIEAPALPEAIESVAAVTLVDSAKFDDPSQALLVVFLVDTSPSMGRHLPAVRRLVAAVLEVLATGDRVALVRFAQSDSVAVAPTTNRFTVLNAIDEMKVTAGEQTWLYRALSKTVQEVASVGADPRLPGRRFVILISDALDNDPSFDSAKLSPALHAFKGVGTVLTIGVGGSRAYADLSTIAVESGDSSRFLADPTPAQLAARVKVAFEPLRSQVAVDFELPPAYWGRGEHEALLTLKLGAKEHSTSFNVKVESLTKEQEKAQADLLAAPRVAAEFIARHEKAVEGEAQRKKEEASKAEDALRQADLDAEKAAAAAATAAKEAEQEAASRKSQIVTWSAIGAAVVVLLVILFLVARRSRRRQEEQADQLQHVQSALSERIESQSQHLIDEARRRAEEAADAARVALGVLLVEDGPMRGRRFGILKPSCIMGRDADQCDLVFPSEGGDPSISRLHAQLTLASGGWSVTCLAEGGMGINSVRLTRGDNYPIRINDRMMIGRSAFRFVSP